MASFHPTGRIVCDKGAQTSDLVVVLN